MRGDAVDSCDATYGRGLEGLVFGDTAICRIDGEAGELWYRGYRLDALAARCSFEEVAWLVLFGELPTAAELTGFCAQVEAASTPPPEAYAVLRVVPDGASVLAAYRTALAVAATAGAVDDLSSVEGRVAAAARILGWTFALGAQAIRHEVAGRDAARVPMRAGAGLAASFLERALGEPASAEDARAFEVSLIVQAEHDIHAAALAALTVASGGGTLEGAVLAGVGALGGPLHGGANRPAYEMLLEFDSVDAAAASASEKVAASYRFPGFGHRIYKTHDPRGRVLAPFARALLARHSAADPDHANPSLWDVFSAIRRVIESKLGPKGIYANVDAFTGLVYGPLGLPVAGFTLSFALALQVGWLAHIFEYLPAGPPVAPRSIYVPGPVADAPDHAPDRLTDDA